MNQPRVHILQEYIPEYRVPFFSGLHAACAAEGIELSVGAGQPQGVQASRRDSAPRLPYQVDIAQRELSALNRRITVRRYPPEARAANLLIIEQARRNLDVYRLLLPQTLLRGQKIALWGHGGDYVTSSTAVRSHLLEMLTRRASHFFAYTEGGAAFASRCGLDPDRVTIVQNSVDTTELRSSLARIEDSEVIEFRRANGLTSTTLLYLGGLDASKRVDFLLASFARAAELAPGLRLLVAGDGEARAAVERAAHDDKRIVYLGRVVGQRKALALRASVAIAVPGRVGLIALESLWSGRPILTTAWDFHAPEFEYLEPGTTCFVSTDDVAAYARLLADTSASAKLQTAQRLLLSAAPTYTIEAMVANFLSGIKKVLAR